MTAQERLRRPRVRLFTALDLPEAVLGPLADWRDRTFGDVAGARLLARAQLHVTLVFLGYRYEREVERIAALCFGEPAGPFVLRATEAAGVPPRRPRLYALSLEDEGGSVTAWQAALSERLHAARLYEPERRPFWPHVTLARGRRDRALPPLEGTAPPPELRNAFAVERAVLYRSTLTPRGAVYDALETMEVRRPGPSS